MVLWDGGITNQTLGEDGFQRQIAAVWCLGASPVPGTPEWDMGLGLDRESPVLEDQESLLQGVLMCWSGPQCQEPFYNIAVGSD